MTELEPSERYVVVRRFRSQPKAEVAKSVLESAGIECFLRDEVTTVCVKSEDAAVAEQLLNQEIPGRFRVEGVGEFDQPRCPNCQSLRISHTFSDKVHKRYASWRCHSCSHEWPDPDLEENDES